MESPRLEHAELRIWYPETTHKLGMSFLLLSRFIGSSHLLPNFQAAQTGEDTNCRKLSRESNTPVQS
jgi:hypothetical protein